jgi:hypothetical protein
LGNTRVIIYESSSIGGCYNYSLALLSAYSKNPKVREYKLILPDNPKIRNHHDETGIEYILFNDKASGSIIKSKLYFIFRVHINPLIFLFYLLRKERSFVLLNDFEQISAWLWVPLYRLFLRKHQFGVFLHDPDRDQYPTGYWYSTLSMRWILNLCSFALYHEVLPDKPYYKNTKTRFIPVKHGIYSRQEIDDSLYNDIIKLAGDKYIVLIPGNLRSEKNYEVAIDLIGSMQGSFLIIAGSTSSNEFSVKNLEDNLYSSLNPNQYLFINKYLSETEMNTMIKVSALVWLYYKPSFVSQSGILNMVANFRKPVLVSSHESPLYHLVREYKLGYCALPYDMEFLKRVLQMAMNGRNFNPSNWDRYINDADWNNQVETVLKHIQN